VVSEPSGSGRPDPIPPFQRFLEEHGPVVYRFLLAHAGPDQADDCYQETFLAALRAYPRLRDASNLRGWVLTIATRKALDAARAGRRRPIAVGSLEDLDGARRPGPSPEDGRGGQAPVDPEDPVWRTVRALPPRQRAAVVHRFVLDRSYRDIAGAMGCSEEAARANVSQGVRRLRRELAGRERAAAETGEGGRPPFSRAPTGAGAGRGR
jgi:RNA polymerase sigma factor (sigma-70 family)